MFRSDVVRRPSLLALVLVLVLCPLWLACAKKKDPAAEADATPEVELDLWAGVPPLDPQAAELYGELVPKPGPQKPEQVGEEIELPFPPPLPPSADKPEIEDPDGPLEVLRSGPDGERALVEAIRASFNHPMVPLASIEDLRAMNAPMQIEPAIEGEHRWLGTRTLAFYPKGRLPFSTTYTVTIPAGTTSTQDTKLAKDVSWTITTPALALDRAVPNQYGETHVRLDQPILLRFNQPIDAQAVSAAITLSGGGGSVPLERVPESEWTNDEYESWINQWVIGGEQDWERSRVLVLRPKTELKPNTSYTVALPAGVYGEGPNKSAKIAYSFTTYPPLKLSPQTCDPSPCSASYGITLEASNQIRDARVAAKVHVTPEVENLEINAGWGGIHIDGDFIGDATYEVVVDEGLEDVYGQKLAKPYKKKIRLGALERDLRVWPKAKFPGIIEAKAGHTLQIKVAGLKTLEVMASSYASAELDEYHEYAHSLSEDYGWPEELPAPRHRETLDVSTSRKQEQTITLDLDDYIDGSDSFVYLVLRSEQYKVWDWNERTTLQQIVQVTNLGMAAAIDRDDAVVLVTDLATGAPVPGAEVKVLGDAGSREVWSGKADQNGVARPKLSRSRIYRPLLLAKHGSDEAYMPLDQDELEGRWVSHLYGEPGEDQVRAFIFTERQPYKPGETVHLVGVLRKETRGPTGGIVPWGNGIKAKYEVTTPRGVKVQEGEVAVTNFGTFAVDIETDENGDTGNYSFSMSHRGLFGGSEHFYHSFAVEAFRTPEFEVEVERPDSTPLYYGDELEVEIRGRYLYGAPMIGADVSYTLTRQATDYRPPVDGLGAFHFSSSPGHRGYWGGFWGGWSPSQQLANQAAKLDAQGILKVTHALAQVEPPPPDAPPPAEPESPESKEEEPAPRAATFSIAATVTDANRQAIAGSGSFVVHPAAYYVGLRSERTVLREQEKTRVEAVVVDTEGKRVEGVDIDLKVVRKETTRTPVEKDGVWTFDYATEETQTASCDLASTSAPVACEVSVGKAGTHEVVADVVDAAGRENRAVIQLYVHGEDAVIWEDEQKRVDLVPDKDSYEPGETAKLLIRSPFDEARGLLVIEREGIASSHEVKVEGGVAVVEVEITQAMVAGVTASVVLTKPRTTIAGAPDDQDLGAPAAASGQIALEVSKDLKTVVVEVTPDRDRIEPGEKLRVDLSTHAVDGEAIPASVALFVVDEGVLSLMGYQTPDPLSFFHHKRAGEVGLYADHPLIFPRQAEEQPKVQEQPHGAFAVGNDDEDVWGGLQGAEVGEAFGVGGLGLVGTGRGGGGVGEGSIGLMPGAPPAEAEEQADRAKNKESKKSGGRAATPAARPAPVTSTASIDANLAMNQEVSLRTLFATTAHFQADVKTDESGRASVEIEMPENLTSFRIMAVAVDPQVLDRFGSGEASVRVRKTLMIRPSLPRFLNLGDRFEASVMIDNQADVDQAVMVGIRGVNVELPGEVETTIEIPAGESREVRFPAAVDHVGTMRLQFAALSNAGRDATQLDIPVIVPATKQAFADYGMTSSSVQRDVLVPENALPGFGGLEVSMSSTALNGLEDAVDFLVTYPYECAEQTASRLLPIFALGDVLDDFPIADVHDRARRDALAVDGIERLFRRQNWDGGFTYWGDDTRQESWPYVSTWVTLALLEGKKAGYEVDQAKLDRALAYLDNYVRSGVTTRWGTYYDWTSRAFAVWLLSREGRGKDLFEKVWAKREQVPLYARVLLAGAAHRYGKSEPVEVVFTELADQVVENAKVIHFAESRTEAAADGLTVLMHSNTQTDAIVLMTLMEMGKETGDDDMAPKIMAGLMDDRDPRLGGRWTSTHANAWALMAASRYYEVMESETPDYVARIWLDDAFAGEQAFAGRDMAKVNQHVPMSSLIAKSGEGAIDSITLAKEGPGKLYYRLGLRYAPKDFEMKPVDRGFTVSRRYEALPGPGEDAPDPEAVKRLEDGTWRVEAGANVKVTLTLTVSDRASYVVVDDPLPAGFEGQNPRFLTSVAATSTGTLDYGYGGGYGIGGGYGRGGYDYDYGYGGYGRVSHGWWYPWYSFDHKQMRDDRMLLFADWLAAGVYTYSYTARATNIGTFVLPPVHAEAMYQPERFGHGSSSRVEIVP